MSARSIDPAQVLDGAIAALNHGDPELPLDEVERALQRAPHDYRLWHIKGLIHREQERREIAIPALRRATELAPTEPLVAHGYARTLLEAGLPSVEAFARAVKLTSGNSDAVRGLASALVAEGRIGDAIEGLDTVLQRSPLWTEGHGLISQLRWARGEREGFTRSYDEALRLHPNSMDLIEQQLVALVEAGHLETALKHTAAGRARFGEQMFFAAHEAVIFSELREDDAADQLFGLLPPGAIATFDVRRVRHHLRCGRLGQAAELLDQWLLSPEQDMFWPYASAAWRLTGDSRSAWLAEDERFVGIYDITSRIPPLPSLAELLRSLHRTPSEPFSQSVRGGTQTDGHLFQRIEPQIVALREGIRGVVREHAAQLPPIDPAHPLLRSRPAAIRFSGAWSVRLTGGGQHANHVHPMGWLSSALYIALPVEVGSGGHAGWLTLGEPQDQLGLELPPTTLIEPRPGRLVLFPSWMWHGTRPFGQGERLTVAFDVAR